MCGATACKTSCTSSARLRVGLLLLVGGQLRDAEGERRRLRARPTSARAATAWTASAARPRAPAAASPARPPRPPRPTASAVRSSAAPIPTASARRTRRCRCGLDGFCDGAGACRRYVAGSTCVPESCSGSTYTPASTCNGAGTCGTATTSVVRRVHVRRDVVPTTCTTSADCTTGNYCSAGACVPKEANGTACIAAGRVRAAATASTASAATPPAAAPARPARRSDSVGTCMAADAGTDPRLECDGERRRRPAATTAPATAPAPAASTPPGPSVWRPGAAAATVHTASTCNGTGTCNAGTTTSCGAYQCDAAGAACRTTCATDANCSGVLQRHRLLRGAREPRGQRRRRIRDATAGWTTNGGDAHPPDRGVARLSTRARTASPARRVPRTTTGRPTRCRRARDHTPSAPGRCRTRTRPRTSRCRSNLGCGEPPAAGTSRRSGVRHQLASGRLDADQRHREPGGRPSACQPGAATPGVVRSAMLYLNQTAAGSPVVFPNLFLDDVVVTVPDGHNLVGNPNFEAGEPPPAGRRPAAALWPSARPSSGPGPRSLQADRPDRRRSRARAGTCLSGAAQVQRHVQRPAQRLVAPRPDPAADVHLPGRDGAVPGADRHRVPGRRQRLEQADRHGHLPARQRAGRVQADGRGRLHAAGRLRRRAPRASVPISSSTMCRSPWHRNVRGTHATHGRPSRRAWRRWRRIAALASLVSLVAAGCSGEQAYSARDASAAGAAPAARAAARQPARASRATAAAAARAPRAWARWRARAATGTAAASGGTGGAAAPAGCARRDRASTDRRARPAADCMSSWCADRVCCATECAGACMTCEGAARRVRAGRRRDRSARASARRRSAATCGTTGVCNGAGRLPLPPRRSGVRHDALVRQPPTPRWSRRASATAAGACVAEHVPELQRFPLRGGAACGTTCTRGQPPASRAPSAAPGPVSRAQRTSPATATSRPAPPPAGRRPTAAARSPSARWPPRGVAHSGGYSVVGTEPHHRLPGPRLQPADRSGEVHHHRLGPAARHGQHPRRPAGPADLPMNVNPGYYVARRSSASRWPRTYGRCSAPPSTPSTCRRRLPADRCDARPGEIGDPLPQSHDGHVPTPFPDLYLDDVVVQVTDGHNLVGNPNFEAGAGRRVEPERRVVDAGDRHHRRPRRHEEPAPERAIDPRRRTAVGRCRPARPATHFVLGAARTCRRRRAGDVRSDAAAHLQLHHAHRPGDAAGDRDGDGGAEQHLDGAERHGDVPAGRRARRLQAVAGGGLRAARGHRLGSGAQCPELFVDDVSITLAP